MGLAANKKVIREFLANVEAGNKQAIADALADDLRWWVLGYGSLDKRLYLEELGQLSDKWAAPMKLTITGITAEGDRVAVEAEIENDFSDGRHYHQYNHFLFRVRDGKICEYKVYFDTKYAAERFGEDMPEVFREKSAVPGKA
jgi:ketosteroid isomerase-like protein